MKQQNENAQKIELVRDLRNAITKHNRLRVADYNAALTVLIFDYLNLMSNQLDIDFEYVREEFLEDLQESLSLAREIYIAENECAEIRHD